MIKQLPWSEFQKHIDGTLNRLAYKREAPPSGSTLARIYAQENGLTYECHMDTGSADYTDYTTRFLSMEGIPRQKAIRMDSRPFEYITLFTSIGDAAGKIGAGKVSEWDFANATDDTTDVTWVDEPIPTGYKRKRLDVTFNGPIHIKEGTVYHFNSPKGQYADLYIVAPSGQYYVDPNGAIPASALGQPGSKMYSQVDPNDSTAEVVVAHYVQHLPMQGDTPMGDELNTEGATEDAVPAGYIIRAEITTPDTDNTSNGCINFEVYRKRTILLPGESL